MEKKVVVLQADADGNFWKEELLVNEALVKLLRFVRDNHHGRCTIELRHDASMRVVPDIANVITKEPS